MTGARLYLYDTTLRDGAQTQGVDFSAEDKRAKIEARGGFPAAAEALDRLGIDYIEGGWPGANPTDDRFLADKPSFKTARLTATFGAGAPIATLVGKSWDFRVTVALGVPLDESLAMIADSVDHATTKVREGVPVAAVA